MGKINFKKTAVILVVFALGFGSALFVQKYNHEKSILKADTGLVYNLLYRTMVKFMDDARFCRVNPDMEIWYRLLNSNVQDVYKWHMERVEEIDLIDAADYIESHRRTYKHGLSYIQAIEQFYADCDPRSLEGPID